MSSLSHAANAGRHPLKNRSHDSYETPACAVHALLRAESLPHYLWEPAAGRGAIVDVLRAAGHEVVASDLVHHGVPSHFHGVDFLFEQKAPDRCQAIITNPPYRLAEQFVAHALDLCPRVYMLLRLAFLESERRAEILERRNLARVHVFSRRLPMMHRDGWTGPRASSATAYAWFVWDRAHTGPTELHRISTNTDAGAAAAPVLFVGGNQGDEK
jgi:hypothetical protein